MNMLEGIKIERKEENRRHLPELIPIPYWVCFQTLGFVIDTTHEMIKEMCS